MLLTALCFLLAINLNDAVNEYYTAAVVEYHSTPNPYLPADQVLLNNAQVFVEYMTNASYKQVDIIVFPEGALHGRGSRNKFVEVPSPTDKIAPCDYNTIYHPAIVLLSCSARKIAMYVVINLSEKFYNTTNDVTEFYNTNVAFDRKGTVVGRYRKYNPYGEGVKKPPVPDHHYFETDFGVSFGMFTCFDIEFMEPAIVMVRQFGIQHFVFPLCWISELPFLTAIQMQGGWSYSMDVVLLAAGCNYPETGGSGSGIYIGKQGAVETIQTDAITSKMLIGQVPVTLKQENNPSTSLLYNEPVNHKYLVGQQKPIEIIEIEFLDNVTPRATTDQTNTILEMLRDYLDVYETIPLVPSGFHLSPPQSTGAVNISVNSDTTLCQNGFCCYLQVQSTNIFSPTAPSEPNRGDDFSRYPYRLVMFDGVRWYGGGLATGGVQVCGIVSCVNDSIASCGLRADDSYREVQSIPDPVYGQLYKTATIFESISITSVFLYNNTFVFPDIFVSGTGDSYGSLLPPSKFSFTTSGPSNGFLLGSLRIDTPVADLITAVIYARQFDRDGEKRTEITSFAHPRTRYSIIAVFSIPVLLLLRPFSNVFSLGAA